MWWELHQQQDTNDVNNLICDKIPLGAGVGPALGVGPTKQQTKC